MTEITLPIEETQSLRGSSNLDWSTPTTKLSNFDELLEQVQADEDLRIIPKRLDLRSRGILKKDDPGYECSHMGSWRWWKNGTIYVPGMGNLLPTRHAKRQIGSHFGIKYDQFLGPMGNDPGLIQQALQPHVNARRDDPKLITKVVARALPKDPEMLGVDGILRGVVSTRYAEIKDIQVLETLRKVGGSEFEEMRTTVTRRTDEATFISIVYPEAKSLAHVDDECLGGFKLWNSEVGGRSLGAAEFVQRLVCSNGMVVDILGDRLLYRRHSGIEQVELERLLREMWTKLPGRFEHIAASAQTLNSITIDDPDAEIERFVGSQGQPQYIRDAAREAFKMEPVNTAYGVLQAITRMATAARVDPNRQLDLEQLGGKYMLQMAPLVTA